MANLETKKVYISLPNEVYVTLESLAREQGRTTSNLGAFAIEYFLGSVAPKMYPLNRTVRNYEPDDDGEDQRNDRSPQETKRQEKSKQS